LEKTPEDIVARGLLAESFLVQKQYPAARRQFLAALQRIRDNGLDEPRLKSELTNNVGVCFDFEGDRKSAARYFSRAIELDPGFAIVAHHNLAKVRFREGQLDQAWKLLESCRERAPENHETIELQSMVLEKKKRYDEAIQLMMTEINTGHATEVGYAWASSLLTDAKGDFDSACRIATEGFKKYPLSALLINNLAYSLLMSGQTVRARQVLESMPRGMKSNGLDVPTVLAATWGLLYLWEGDIERGSEQYELAERLACEVPQSELRNIVRQKMHLELARAYLRRQDIASAEAEISLGLSVRAGRDIYAQSLMALRNELENPRESDLRR
jgi:Tfp pilus assembly protein PilF